PCTPAWVQDEEQVLGASAASALGLHAVSSIAAICAESHKSLHLCRRRPLEPTATSEEDEEGREYNQFRADPECDKGFPAADVFDHEAEVLSEEPGEPAEGQEDGRDDRELLHDRVEAIRDSGQVDVHRTGEEVSIA